MDRQYYQMTEAAIEVARLANAIARNADYKPEIKAATDLLLRNCVDDIARCRRTMEEVIKRQMNVAEITPKKQGKGV